MTWLVDKIKKRGVVKEIEWVKVETNEQAGDFVLAKEGLSWTKAKEEMKKSVVRKKLKSWPFFIFIFFLFMNIYMYVSWKGKQPSSAAHNKSQQNPKAQPCFPCITTRLNCLCIPKQSSYQN